MSPNEPVLWNLSVQNQQGGKHGWSGVSHVLLLAQCQALTQACGYSEGKGWGGSLAPSQSLPSEACGREGTRML